MEPDKFMKIAYLGRTLLSDVDFSYLEEAQKKSDIDYYIEITPRYLKGAAINLSKVYYKTGVFKATDVYPEFNRYREIVDLNKIFVVNTAGGKLWPIKAIWTNLLLLLLLIKRKYKVIHITWPLNIYEFCLYFLRRRMLMTVHDPFPHTGDNHFIPRVRRYFAFKIVPKFVMLNSTQKDEFCKKYGIKSERVIDSWLGPYNYLLKIPERPIKKLPQKYILFIGRITPYKGIEYLLPAMEIVHEKCPDICLVVAGKGQFFIDISSYKHKQYIEFLNYFIEDEELITLIKNALCVVCPYTDATQSGVVMSAFTFGIPVIASDVGALPEIVINNKYGIIVRARDVDALSTGILKLVLNDELVVAFSKNIIESYQQGDKSWGIVSKNLRLEYEKIAM